MNEHVLHYYGYTDEEIPRKKFSKVISFHDCPDMDWENLCDSIPALPKGWHELCQLPRNDRIQFTLDYWLAKLPYHLHLDEAISQFFGELDDVGCFATQVKKSDPLKVEMVYSVSQNRGFYRGAIPASEEDVIDLQKLFLDYILPEDYLAFLQIHNGFCKTTDCTGIMSAEKVASTYKQLQALIASQGMVTTTSGNPVDPKGLIPFYKSFGMPYYQCFWSGWHPEQEMGNVYYSGEMNSISEIGTGESSEAMTFPTFLDWLIFYLEQMNI